jgi:hypothetical protein
MIVSRFTGDVIISSEWLQNLGLLMSLKTFEQGGIFIVQYLLWQRASVFEISSSKTSHLITPYDKQRESNDMDEVCALTIMNVSLYVHPVL